MPRGVGCGTGGNGSWGRRTKKLIVAFHFQFANQAGWKCDACRQAGLERKRRCGWLPELAAEATSPVVWARRRVSLTTCPKSYITAESEALVEEFFVRRRLGGMNFARLSAKQVDAFLVLDQVLAEELADRQTADR